MIKNIRKNALALGLVGAICTLTVSLANLHTKGLISSEQELRLRQQVTHLLPAGSFDNDPSLNCRIYQDLNGLAESRVFVATKEEQEVAYIVETSTRQGYSGLIEMIVAIQVEGTPTIAGVRVVEHTETPGLGDKVELRKSEWILSFNGMQLEAEPDPRWAVTKEGGQFDAFTGATITPRAVINAVHDTLLDVSDASFASKQVSASCDDMAAKG